MPGRRRRHGQGSVYQHGNRWVAQVTLHVAGRRRYATRWRRTEAEAKLALDELLARHGDATADSPRQTLDRYLGTWLHHHRHGIRASTVTSYAGHIERHISPVLGGIPLERLRPAHIRRLIDDRLSAGLSAATVRRVLTTLAMALNAAVRDGMLVRSPLSGVRLPRVEREPVRAMTEADMARILGAVAGTWLELPVRVWLGSGLRRGEVLGLDQCDLVLDEGYVRVRITKTKVRAVPLSDDAVAALREALTRAPRRGPAEPVFYGARTGERLRGDAVTAALVRRTAAAGIRVSPHALRHGVASLMVAQGVHMRIIADQLGHSDPGLTARIYAHVVPQAQREAIRGIGVKR